MSKQFIEDIEVNLNTKKYRIQLRDKSTVFYTVKEIARSPKEIDYFEDDLPYAGYEWILTADCGTQFYKHSIDKMTASLEKNTHKQKFKKYEITEGIVSKDTRIEYEKIY